MMLRGMFFLRLLRRRRCLRAGRAVHHRRHRPRCAGLRPAT
jgi:hypothetical protein